MTGEPLYPWIIEILRSTDLKEMATGDIANALKDLGIRNGDEEKLRGNISAVLSQIAKGKRANTPEDIKWERRNNRYYFWSEKGQSR